MANIINLRNALRFLLKKYPGLPLNYVLVLAEVSLSPGCSLSFLSKKLNLSLSTISRIIQALADEQNYGLVKISPHETSRRQKKVLLTNAGERINAKILQELTSSSNGD
jgi:DNA-binding MarR family transcriptional regulator